MKITFIIPTHNRTQLLDKLISQFSRQSFKDYQLIIIDSSYKFFSDLNFKCLKKLNNEKIIYFHSYEKGTAYKRNLGFNIYKKNNIKSKWIVYLDDDIEFDDIFIEKLNNEIVTVTNFYKDKLKIAAFGVKINQNIDTPTIRNVPFFLKIFNSLGLYPSKAGMISSSGWHSPHDKIKNTTQVDWLPTGILIVDAELNEQIKFDLFFSDYGYLEDLDFSFSLNQIASLFYLPKLSVQTKFKDRSDFNFGVNEVFNRFYFVKKHKLSYLSFSLMVILRLFYSLILSIFRFNGSLLKRFFGNLKAIISIISLKKLKLVKNQNNQNNLNILIDFSSSIHGGGTSFLYDLSFSYKQRPGININIISTTIIDDLKNISHQYFKSPQNFLLKYIYLKLFFIKNYNKFDFVVSGTSYNIKKRTIFISQNDISIDKFVINKFYSKQKIRQFFIRKRVLRAVQKSYYTVAPSINSRNLLLNYVSNTNKIKVINNFSFQNQQFIERKYNYNSISFLYVSNYAPHKMHQNLINAFWILYKKNYDFTLTCVGKWSFNTIKKSIYKSDYTKELLSNKKIILLDEKNRRDIFKLHNDHDIFIFPSTCESGSMSLLEAMKSSMPVLSSSMTSNIEYTDNQSHYFDPMNVNSIVKIIEDVYSKKIKLNSNSKSMYEVSKKFNYDKIIDQYLNCFESN